jgi:hypothetical protein
VTSALEATVSVLVPVPVAVSIPEFPYGALILVICVFSLCWESVLVILLLNLDAWFFQARLPLWVCALLAARSIRTETSEVIGAHLFADVFLGTSRPQRAEALVVVGAGWQLALGVDVQVETLIAVGAEAVAQEEVALGHLPQVELVQELAALSLFAQATQPVLADERVERVAAVLLAAAVGDGDVTLRAAGPEGAVAVDVGFTYWAISGKAVEVGSLEEWRE